MPVPRVYQRITRPSNQGGPKSTPVAPAATDEQVAWAAGIIEGEGTIHLSKGRWPAVRVEVMMNDLDVLQMLQVRFGGVINGPYQYAHQSNPSWRWGLYRQEIVRPFLLRILPWLGLRRAAKAKEVLDNA